jgi:hypothetical protein
MLVNQITENAKISYTTSRYLTFFAGEISKNPNEDNCRLHPLNDLIEEIGRRKNDPNSLIISADNTRKNMMPGAYF